MRNVDQMADMSSPKVEEHRNEKRKENIGSVWFGFG